MKHNEDQKTLTLPFLDFKDTDVNINSKNAYEKNGIYFVRNTVGEYIIVSVIKEEDNVWVWSLPPALQESFFQQNMEQQQADKFEQLEQRLMNIHNDILARLDEQYSVVRNDVKDVCYIANRIEDNVGILANIEEHLSSNNPNSEHPNGGYVDQDVLLQIIKDVKR